MATFTFDFNFFVPQYPMCKMEIILLPYLVSLINVVKHSDSDKQQRKAKGNEKFFIQSSVWTVARDKTSDTQ